MLRALGEPDLAALVDHLVRHAAESGARGGPIFGPHEHGAAPDRDRLRARRRVGWLRRPGEVGWERTWGWVEGGLVVGHIELHGGRLSSELHRCTLGMGIEADYRGHGRGRALVSAALAWARDQATLAWVDLGVFAHNHAARALYQAHGFREVGRTADRFRVDGTSIDDVLMTRAL